MFLSPLFPGSLILISTSVLIFYQPVVFFVDWTRGALKFFCSSSLGLVVVDVDSVVLIAESFPSL